MINELLAIPEFIILFYVAVRVYLNTAEIGECIKRLDRLNGFH